MRTSSRTWQAWCLGFALLGAGQALGSASSGLPSLGRAGGGAIALSDEYQLGLQIMREIRRQGGLFGKVICIKPPGVRHGRGRGVRVGNIGSGAGGVEHRTTSQCLV